MLPHYKCVFIYVYRNCLWQFKNPQMNISSLHSNELQVLGFTFGWSGEIHHRRLHTPLFFHLYSLLWHHPFYEYSSRLSTYTYFGSYKACFHRLPFPFHINDGHFSHEWLFLKANSQEWFFEDSIFLSHH